uniref:4-coumarate--CoA ligase n=1 Tax=Oryza brachyantha TaxID=4533 RepID=J3KVD4_ORYBR
MVAPMSLANPGGGSRSVNPRTGYCATTKSFHSLRPPVPLPPPDVPLSFPEFAFTLLQSSSRLLDAHPALLDAATGEAVSFPAFLSRVRAVAGALRSRVGLRPGDVALVLAPTRIDVPVLYFGLLSIGAVVSPANPTLTRAEVSRLVSLSGASVAFAISSTASKLPAGLPAVLLDSPHFRSLCMDEQGDGLALETAVVVRQSDTAAIQFSSGTTGQVKAAALPHRSFIAMVAGFHALHAKPQSPRKNHERALLCAPMFHSMGFFFVLKDIALGVTTVVVTDTAARAGIRGLVETAEHWEVTEMTAAPPVVMGMTKERCRLTALDRIICGGAPLSMAAIERFRRRFPHVDLCMLTA